MQAPDDFIDFRQKVDLMLDNALSKDAEAEVMKRVATDPEFYKMYETEKYFRDFVRSHVVRPKVTKEFIESIKEKIRIV